MIENLVFEGGGILGISYLGAIKCLNDYNILPNIKKVAGTSVGAITACILSFNLPFNETKEIIETIEYKNIPGRKEESWTTKIPSILKQEITRVFGDINGLYRLIFNYGWFSSEYIYEWLKQKIAEQFDQTKKGHPYTFADFQNMEIRKRKSLF